MSLSDSPEFFIHTHITNLFMCCTFNTSNINMLIILQFISIIYALYVIIGAFIIVFTAYKWERKKDDALFRARAFLSESFLKDNWTLLLFVFFLNSITPLDEMLSTFIVDATCTVKIPIIERTKYINKLNFNNY